MGRAGPEFSEGRTGIKKWIHYFCSWTYPFPPKNWKSPGGICTPSYHFPLYHSISSEKKMNWLISLIVLMLLKIYKRREKRELSPLRVVFLMSLYHIQQVLELPPFCWNSSQPQSCAWTSPHHMAQGTQHLNFERTIPALSPFYSGRK